jgi:hypothetical protein
MSALPLSPGYAAADVSTPLFRIDDRARPSPSLARFALGPVSLVAAFGLFYGGHISQFAAMCIAGVGLISFQWANVLAGSSRDAYDRAAVALLSKGRAKDLGARLQAALPFRLFGAAAEWSARRGAVLAAEGSPEPAAKAWAEAVAGYRGGAVPRSVALGFASAAFDAGWDRDASRAYRALYQTDPDLPRVRTRLAHALARLGEDLDEAETLLAVEAKSESDDAVAAREALKEARSAGDRPSKKPGKKKKAKKS